MSQSVQPFTTFADPVPGTPDYGTDFDCTSDLNPAMPLVTGRVALVQALYRRLITPRGGLWYDPNYGVGVQGMLNAGLTPSQLSRIGSLVDAEFAKDDRVVASTTTATFAGGVLSLTAIISDGSGPFPLSVAVSSVTVALLTPTV